MRPAVSRTLNGFRLTLVELSSPAADDGTVSLFVLVDQEILYVFYERKSI